MSAEGSGLAIVVIGRNEGDHLIRCLDSCRSASVRIVFVDSGSTDQSLYHARVRGTEVVELDPAKPFTAARARNAGLARARSLCPALRFVQFVDGDCELASGWIDLAQAALSGSPDVVAVCGRRRERHPDASPYNRLCDLEWDTPVGEAAACGGDVMMRVEAIVAVGGYAESLIAGEDPELCHRLRASGGRILRLDHEMTLHDADMHRFTQWWRRSRRAGHAYAECWHRHRATGFRMRELRSIAFWGLGLPLLVLVSISLVGIIGTVWLLAYGLLYGRVLRGRLRGGDPVPHARLYAGSIVIGKWAQGIGALEYLWNQLRNRRSAIIEYKAPS